MTRLGLLISSVFYIGYFPIAPGTAGSAAGLVVYALMRLAGAPPLADLALIVALFALGCWSGTVAERYFRRTDPGQVVLDEVIGMLITLAFLPASWTLAVVGFFVFRALDIVKPPPARQCERLHGGLGIMMDDVVSAIYGNLLLRLALLAAPGWLTGM